MRLASLEALFLLLAVALIVATLVWIERWRRRARVEFAGPQAARWGSGGAGLSALLLVVAATLIVLAIARPQWGSSELRREHQGVDVVIVLDISMSMQGTDVSPSRLGLAQAEVVRLIENLRGNRMGIVFFAGGSIVRSPLSTDTQALADITRRASRELGLVRAGSDIGQALHQAGRILEHSESPGKAVILVSDGEDHVGRAVEEATALAENGVVILTAGVGTPEGSTIMERSLSGQMRLKVDATGAPVITRLDEATLRAVSSAGNGRYIRVSEGGNGLQSLREDLARLEQTPSGEESERVPVERFQYFAAAALALLCLAWLLPARLALPPVSFPGRLRPHPGLTLVLLALLVGGCMEEDPLRRENSAANRLYEAGSYQEAAEAYQRLLAQRPDIEELSYNLGNAFHRLGRFERAVVETQRALPPTSTRLGAKTYYALGNHFLALDRLPHAFEAYRHALLLDPTDADAKYNLEYVLLLLNPESEPPAGQQQPGQGDGEQQDGEPQPGEEGPSEPGQSQDQGAPGGQPQDGDQQMSPADVRRALAEALAGLEDEISPEEAIRILDLLRQQREIQAPGRQSPGGGPDY
jgi:tetratricopeptide (TPR) repeat protein/Mg-chelatase subunit ChlD